MILIDTNVLLRMAEPNHVQHGTARRSVEMLRQQDRLVVLPQCLYEFWAVATRPIEANGLGRTLTEANDGLDEIEALFTVLRDERGVLRLWRQLVTTYDVKGLKSHDTRLVAAMLRHEVDQLLTFNASDFQRYTEITVLDPLALVSGSA